MPRRSVGIEPLDLDLDEIRREVMTLLEQSYNHDGLPRTEVLWLIETIHDLIWKIERDVPE